MPRYVVDAPVTIRAVITVEAASREAARRKAMKIGLGRWLLEMVPSRGSPDRPSTKWRIKELT